MKKDRVEIAIRRAKAKMFFLWHFAVYIVATIVLVVINNVVGSDNQWWIWPALFWGIMVVGHFLKSFVFNNNLEERLMETELKSMEDENGEKK